MQRGDFCYWLSITVRWGDMDAIGHVNNAAYFTYCESARLGYLEQIGFGPHGSCRSYPCRNMNVGVLATVRNRSKAGGKV